MPILVKTDNGGRRKIVFLNIWVLPTFPTYKNISVRKGNHFKMWKRERERERERQTLYEKIYQFIRNIK